MSTPEQKLDEVDLNLEQVNLALHSIDFKRLFTGVFKIGEEMLGADAPEEWNAEGRADKLSTFSDFLNTLQEAVPGLAAEQVQEGFVEAIEEIHPTDNV